MEVTNVDEDVDARQKRKVVMPVDVSKTINVLAIPNKPHMLPLMASNDKVSEYWSVLSGGKTLWFSKEDLLRRRPAGNGLRQFAMYVLKKVEKKGSTTYNEVADELVKDMNTSIRSVLRSEEKNIRRRVYDALNVLLALKIIYKDKKAIIWAGMPATVMTQCQRLEKEYSEQQRRIEQKKQEVKELLVQLIAFKSLLARNRELERVVRRNDQRVKVCLPFIVVNTSKQTVVDCWLSSDRRAYMLNFDRRFEIHDDVEVLKRMGMAFGLERGLCPEQSVIDQIFKLVPEPLHNCALEHMTKKNPEATVTDNSKTDQIASDEAFERVHEISIRESLELTEAEDTPVEGQLLQCENATAEDTPIESQCMAATCSSELEFDEAMLSDKDSLGGNDDVDSDMED